MPIALLIILSKSLTYIRNKNGSTLEPSWTPYGIIFIVPGLVTIASNYRNLTAPYNGFIYILCFNVIMQSQGTLLLFIFHMNMRYICYNFKKSHPGCVCIT
jgi:uncharacterized membrane protein